MTKRLVVIGMAVMTTLLALVVLWQFRMVVVYVLISVALAAALRPLVSRLARPGVVRRVVWILLYLAVLGSFGFLLFQTGKTVINEIQQLAHTLSVRDAWRLPLWLQGSSFDQALAARLPPPSKLFDAIAGERGQLVLPAILGFTQGIGGLVTGAAIILFEYLLEHQSDSF
jgi:predicted PurR-regulated permease PerM